MVVLKSREEIDIMRQAGRIVADVIATCRSQIKPGMTTREVDQMAEEIIRKHGAEPSFKNYKPDGAPYPFPASICASINDEIVHGIPGDRKLKDGDVFEVVIENVGTLRNTFVNA